MAPYRTLQPGSISFSCQLLCLFGGLHRCAHMSGHWLRILTLSRPLPWWVLHGRGCALHQNRTASPRWFRGLSRFASLWTDCSFPSLTARSLHCRRAYPMSRDWGCTSTCCRSLYVPISSMRPWGLYLHSRVRPLSW